MDNNRFNTAVEEDAYMAGIQDAERGYEPNSSYGVSRPHVQWAVQEAYNCGYEDVYYERRAL